MRRRDLITAIAGWAAAWPVIARAQQSLPLIGFMSSRSSQDYEPHKEAFLHGLSEAGYAPGQNVRIEYRWADGHYERLAEIAAELVKLCPAVLVAAGGEPAVAAKSATAAIPIVFVIGGSPVRGLRGWGRAREADAACMLLTRVLGRLGVARGEAKPVSIEEFLAQIAAPASKIPKQDG